MSSVRVTVSGLDGASHEVAIDEEVDDGDSLTAKARTAIALPESASIKLYASSGTPIEAGMLLSNQGIGDGSEVAMVVASKLTDENIKDAVKRWFDPETRQAVVDEFGHISDWEVSAVTNMESLFLHKHDFNEDLSRWDVSSVQTMARMFWGARSFNQPVEAWDMSRVTNCCQMFFEAQSFNQPVQAWDTSRVENMFRMFSSTASFNQPLEAWDVGKVKDTNYMFQGGYIENRDRSNMPTWLLPEDDEFF